jgi:hypothetical protein
MANAHWKVAPITVKTDQSAMGSLDPNKWDLEVQETTMKELYKTHGKVIQMMLDSLEGMHLAVAQTAAKQWN